MTETGVAGGEKWASEYQRHKKNAKKKLSIRVGFFSKARYQNGTPVAYVAALHEFGVRDDAGKVKLAERPFFRSALKKIANDKELTGKMTKLIDPVTGQLSRKNAEIIGLFVASEIQKSVRKFKVIRTGHLRRSVSWVVDKT